MKRKEDRPEWLALAAERGKHPKRAVADNRVTPNDRVHCVTNASRTGASFDLDRVHHVFPLLLEALTAGAVRLRFGRITGRSGYVDPLTRTVVLNPDADPEKLAHELAHDLAALMDSATCPAPRLELAHSSDEPEIPAPRAVVGLDGPTVPHLRVAE